MPKTLRKWVIHFINKALNTEPILIFKINTLEHSGLSSIAVILLNLIKKSWRKNGIEPKTHFRFIKHITLAKILIKLMSKGWRCIQVPDLQLSIQLNKVMGLLVTLIQEELVVQNLLKIKLTRSLKNCKEQKKLKELYV